MKINITLIDCKNQIEKGIKNYEEKIIFLKEGLKNIR
jgi:hypothetical protein